MRFSDMGLAKWPWVHGVSCSAHPLRSIKVAKTRIGSSGVLPSPQHASVRGAHIGMAPQAFARGTGGARATCKVALSTRHTWYYIYYSILRGMGHALLLDVLAVYSSQPISLLFRIHVRSAPMSYKTLERHSQLESSSSHRMFSSHFGWITARNDHVQYASNSRNYPLRMSL